MYKYVKIKNKLIIKTVLFAFLSHIFLRADTHTRTHVILAHTHTHVSEYVQHITPSIGISHTGFTIVA